MAQYPFIVIVVNQSGSGGMVTMRQIPFVCPQLSDIWASHLECDFRGWWRPRECGQWVFASTVYQSLCHGAECKFNLPPQSLTCSCYFDILLSVSQNVKLRLRVKVWRVNACEASSHSSVSPPGGDNANSKVHQHQFKPKAKYLFKTETWPNSFFHLSTCQI